MRTAKGNPNGRAEKCGKEKEPRVQIRLGI